MVVYVNYASAGCLPDSDFYPAEFDTFREAWEFVASELERDEDDETYLPAHCDLHTTDFDKPGYLAHAGTYGWEVYEYDEPQGGVIHFPNDPDCKHDYESFKYTPFVRCRKCQGVALALPQD